MGTGAGFVSLVLSLFLIVAAFVLIVLVRTRWSEKPIVVIETSSVKKVQQMQGCAGARGCGHLGLAAAGALMLFVACPMSIVAVAAPYWTGSQDVHGTTLTSSATLWTVSITTEGQGTTVEQDADMCGDDMQKSEDDDSCGKIEAVRFFTIFTLLLALAAAAVLLVAFSPTCREKPDLRSKLCLAG